MDGSVVRASDVYLFAATLPPRGDMALRDQAFLNFSPPACVACVVPRDRGATKRMDSSDV